MNDEYLFGKTYVFKATFETDPSEADKQDVAWAWKKEGGEIQFFNEPGFIDEDGDVAKRIIFNEDLVGETIYLMSYLDEPDVNVSLKFDIVGPSEVIIIAGTEQYSATYGNKMMFPAQAVREIRQNYSTEEYVSLLLFKDGYNTEQVRQVKDSAISHNANVNFVELTSVTDLINHFNTGLGSVDRTNPNEKGHLLRVGMVKIFAHGLPSILDFGLAGSNQRVQRFTSEHVSQLEIRMFNGATIESYACRTGNADRSLSVDTEFGYGADWETKVNPSASLSQNLADHLDIQVYSYLQRTNYTPTWDDKEDEDFQEGYEQIKDEDLNGQIFRPWQWDEALWHDDGAYAPPRVGDTPRGLPPTMYLFEKGEEPRPVN